MVIWRLILILKESSSICGGGTWRNLRGEWEHSPSKERPKTEPPRQHRTNSQFLRMAGGPEHSYACWLILKELSRQVK